MAQHQNLAKRRTVLALLSHGYLSYTVASDAKLLEASRGLGTGGRRRVAHRPPARERGRKQGTVARIVVCVKSLEKLIPDVFLVVDHDYDLKNRCSPGRL